MRFENIARDAIAEGHYERLIDYQTLGDDARLSIPTPEHYLPLMYVLGAAQEDEPVTFFNSEIDLGSVSMLGVVIGQSQRGSEDAHSLRL